MKIFYFIFLIACLSTCDIFAQSDTLIPSQPHLIEVPSKNGEFFEHPFTYVERMPQFPGGIEDMYKYIYANLRYPESAKTNNITGQVIVQFIVTAEGDITKTKVIRSIGYGCDEEAVRVIDSMNESNKWIPGSHNGRPVPVTFTLPIKFHLEKR